jgi:hypothetical protein
MSDLSQLSLSDLQKIARHTARRERNWSRETPRIIGAVRTIQCEGIDGPLSILAVIPGTNMLMLHSTGQLFCYDLATTFWPSQRIGKIHGHAQFGEHGKHFIAMFHVNENAYACHYNHFVVYHIKSQLPYVYRHLLEVFCVDYGPGAPNVLRNVYQKNTFPLPIFFLAVFMQDSIVGMIYANSLTVQLFLVAFNIYTNASITIPLPHIPTSVRYTSPCCHLP